VLARGLFSEEARRKRRPYKKQLGSAVKIIYQSFGKFIPLRPFFSSFATFAFEHLIRLPPASGVMIRCFNESFRFFL